MAAPGKEARAPAARVAPNQTLYISNLPSAKIQKQDLRRSIYLLFSTYGSVLDVVVLKTMKMRGQAHVAFKDVQSAKWAMQELQGFELLGFKIKIEYAKSKSRKIAMMDGTFRMPEKAAEGVNAPATTDLQKSIFAGPPTGTTSTGTAAVAGTKRAREEEEDKAASSSDEEEEDVEMEVDDDDD